MRRNLFIMLAVMAALASCRGGNGRRETPEDDGNTVRMVENPYWKLYYDGRLPVEDGGQWYVCDIVGNVAIDNETYYLSVIKTSDFSSVYSSNVYKFCSADLEDLKKQGIALSTGSSEVYFDVLDSDGGVQYTAIAYGVSSDGKLSGSYRKGTFTTQKISPSETDTWSISYTGREKDENGKYVDVFDIKAATTESYRVDVTYDDYIKENYGGDLMTYFNALADNLFADEVSLDYGSTTYLFDRLTTGLDWTAYAVGFDANGNPTGRYAALDFVIPSETPSEDFLSWLGDWKIGSGKVAFVENGNVNTVDEAKSFDIRIESADPNWDFVFTGWEAGDNADYQGAWGDGSPYEIFASYDRDKGTLVFESQNIGRGTDESGNYDIVFLGNIVWNGTQYFCTDVLPVAEAVQNADAGTAKVNGLPIRAIMDDASVYNTEFTSMQLYDIYVGGGRAYTYNDVPQFPLNMAHVSKAAAPATKAAQPTARRRKVSCSGRSSTQAPAGGVRSLATRGASGAGKDVKKADKPVSNVGVSPGKRG